MKSWKGSYGIFSFFNLLRRKHRYDFICILLAGEMLADGTFATFVFGQMIMKGLWQKN